ncbi:hypothetical protein V7S43_010674 [Phytophthora oleae]|uniref:Uncharacterized protein n=1 Tax=Phytophthora oleae TaxID=2107226 RepID=A0ABD3FBR8_9STRA
MTGGYVQSEQQALKSRWMIWCEGRIFIVDLAEGLHEKVVVDVNRAMRNATGTGDNNLVSSGAAYIGEHRRTLPADVSALLALLEPDCSFGPRENLRGAELPPSFNWWTFHTLKVEVGVFQTWGGPGGLDFKTDAWRQCPGVEYVLCIHISADLNVCQFRLDSTLNGDMPPTDIVNNSVLEFDARRLLWLPPGADLPAGFNDPVRVNLFNVVEPILTAARRQIALDQAEQALEDAAGLPRH